MMKQRSELHLLVPERGLAHTLQPGGHFIDPALRPGSARYGRVSLDWIPSLRQLRFRALPTAFSGGIAGSCPTPPFMANLPKKAKKK
jgi:hypothetical protein